MSRTGTSPGPTSARARRLPRARAISGTVSEAGAKPSHAGVRAPRSVNAKPPNARGSSGFGSPGKSQTASAASARQRSARLVKRSSPAASSPPPRPAPRAPLARGRVARTRTTAPRAGEQHTTAAGSSSGGRSTVQTASVGTPRRRARSTASSRRARSRSSSVGASANSESARAWTSVPGAARVRVGAPARVPVGGAGGCPREAWRPAGRMPPGGRGLPSGLCPAARDRDLARAHHLDQAERPHHLLEGLRPYRSSR